MRLLNVCPFKVGDVVSVYDGMETLIHRVEWSDDWRGVWLLYWFRNEGETYWVVNPEDPNHSGIRLLKRGDE